MFQLPDVVTHNYDPARGACRNICALSDAAAERILDDIRAAGRHSLKLDYLQRRRQAEAWLISERCRKLGRTKLERPIYFFLGDFADGKDASRSASIVLPLRSLPATALTFTYADSMASFAIGTRDDRSGNRRPCHGQVYTLDEIISVVGEFGMPSDEWSDTAGKYNHFIEVQVWDDGPIEDWIHASEQMPRLLGGGVERSDPLSEPSNDQVRGNR